MIRIRDITMPPGYTPYQLQKAAGRIIGVRPEDFAGFRLARKSLDARKKDSIQWVCTVDVELSGDEAAALRRGGSKASPAPAYHYDLPRPAHLPSQRPVVVGFGPAGMFAALVLAEAGLCPIVLERGCDAKTRQEKVARFWKSGELDTRCNVQFGEGGAGTFSDGKLNTGTNDPRNRWVLEQLVRFGAQENILYDAKPHVGTDVLLHVVQALRKRVIELGGEVRFLTRLADLQCKDGSLASITVETATGVEKISCDRLILAIGHSARDTFRMLGDKGLFLEPKPFAMGVRIEHLQAYVNRSQYGQAAPKALPPADYKLFHHLGDKTVYSFCMCPGGFVVAAASEEGGIVTNGMSYSGRNGANANSALLVSLNPKDFPYEGVFGGMQWQEELERKAYAMSNSYAAPCQRVEDFLCKRKSTGFGDVSPTYAPGVYPEELHSLLPEAITAPMEAGILALSKKLSCFAHPDALLTGPETRSSSPVRICRGEDKQSSLKGLFPAGEGAGYAGGILSAAADGIRCAEAVIGSYGIETPDHVL